VFTFSSTGSIKTANVLDKPPKQIQPHAKGHLHGKLLYSTEQTFDRFVATDDGKHLKATECRHEDRDAQLAFHGLLATRCQSLPISKPIASNYAVIH